MEKGFFLTKDVPILLYGENDFAKQTFWSLRENGYDVRGIVDQKYASAEITGEITGFALNDLACSTLVEECIVIICLQNGMLHEKVAATLYSMGMRKIIYLPMGICSSLKYQERCRRIYRLIRNFQYDKVGEVPCYRTEKNPVIVIEKEEEWVSFWCPVKYLRSATVELINAGVPERLQTAKPKLAEYANVTIEKHKPYIELFKWLSGKKADIDFYLEAMGRITEPEKKKLLLDRKKLYKVYEQAARYNMGFFLDAPAQAELNTGGGYLM